MGFRGFLLALQPRIISLVLTGIFLTNTTACGVKKDPVRPADIKEKDRKHKLLD